jgi:hypothetical protein
MDTTKIDLSDTNISGTGTAPDINRNESQSSTISNQETQNKSAEGKSDQTPSPSASIEANQINEAQMQFQGLVKEVNQLIPTQRELQNLSEQQAHFTPKVIVNASLGIGRIAQAISDNPNLTEDGKKFYRACAENEESPNSIRAACYFNYEEILKKTGSHDPSLKADPKISDNVKSLAHKLDK